MEEMEPGSFEGKLEDHDESDKAVLKGS